MPGSFDKKGTKKFILDKLVRLGIPLLAYIFILNPFLSYMVNILVRGNSVTYLQIIQKRIVDLNFDPGHLWFVFSLLIYTLVYTLFRSFSNYGRKNNVLQPAHSFPKVITILFFIIKL